MAGSALDDEYDDEKTTASDLRVTKRTLRKWRAEGRGPPYVEIARRFYYSRGGRCAWLRSLQVTPTRSVRAA
jgi:hypothetical protein